MLVRLHILHFSLVLFASILFPIGLLLALLQLLNFGLKALVDSILKKQSK